VPWRGRKSSSAVGTIFVFGAAIVVGISNPRFLERGAKLNQRQPFKYKIDNHDSQGCCDTIAHQKIVGGRIACRSS
jgi:hypothetical protein